MGTVSSSTFRTAIVVPPPDSGEGTRWGTVPPAPSLGGLPDFASLPVPTQDSRPYPFLNTMLDTYDNLNRALQGRLPAVAKTVAEVVGHLLIKLTHDHLLPLDYWCYGDVLLQKIALFNEYNAQLKVGEVSLFPLRNACFPCRGISCKTASNGAPQGVDVSV